MIMNRHKMRTEINNTSCYHPLQLTGHKYKFPCHGMYFPLQHYKGKSVHTSISTRYTTPFHWKIALTKAVSSLFFEKGIYLVGLVENNSCSSRKLSSNFTIEPIILLHSFIHRIWRHTCGSKFVTVFKLLYE